MTIPDTITSPDSPSAPLGAQIGAFASVRTVMNTGYRMVYPFLPVIARGLGIDLTTAALIVTARSTVGLVSPLAGSTADAWGRRTAMLTALLVSAASMFAVVLWPTFSVLVVAMALAASAKYVFEPAMQAYLSDRIRYERRGMILAITELGWSAAFLIGVPLVGLSIQAYGWSAPFPWLAGLTLLFALVVWRILPQDRRHASTRLSFRRGVQIVVSHLPALAGLSMGFMMTLANEMIGIVYGQWMEDSFKLQVVALGLASTVIGVSELAGEGLVAGLVDRLGKRRSVMTGIGLNGIVALVLPLAGRTLVGALAGLFLFYLTFEFSVVSAIPLMTELVPDARATLMAGNAAALSFGRAIGAFLGPILYLHGLQFNGMAAAAANGIGIVLLALFVKLE